MTHRIGIIGGDGIGPEVVGRGPEVRRRRRRRLRRRSTFDLGGARYLRDGEVLPDERPRGDPRARRDPARRGRARPTCRRACSSAGSCCCAAVRARSLREPPPVRRRRPTPVNDGVDLVVVRENTEGMYAGEGGFLRKGTPHEVATQGSVNTRMGVERCVRYAFELARVARAQAPHARAQDQRAHVRRRPLAAHVRRRSRPSTPTSTTAYNHVDAACIYFVQDPGRYDVIVTDNLFGDILTDLGGAVAGWDRAGRVGQPEPGAHRAVALRAGARLGARHRRHRARPIRAPRSSRPR